ncbi:nucleotide exchange factor GrpE [Bacillus sp. GM2]|jgi:molecular chaperone GrpE|uniref:Protein GrpE n=2 Tax=Bacillus licheniformis TaxID=1402 RepID=GRPE_BACLD|nr:MULTISPECIES: nucleotide exchange factor GrpE [Bacillus]Q65H53.1 RecName: Full=Protein GrpE; AltName: Full=HSP-70 cofactor [Bacillus licheniformis DSM 13 = ATCC 14580]MBJ7883887.1 nucleotide exchange factor GrpE [Bacillaceae bacterium HSR45]MBY8347270.1 nucleotide exchange factor GrpE [Bacillus sp. PCH94]MDP4080244.1 nucleotide exchange factor GrpE [Bacillota bacterium]AAU24250.2 heat-shock protein [Bacillus licheniformis DSM 13 = ATCC 14580]AAU41611.1 heat-shock protein GrpE [Bacillus lic
MAEEKQNEELNEQEELNETEAETAEAEQTAAEADAPAEETQTEMLEKQLKELQERLEEKENKLLRVQADFENYKRRARLDLEAAEKYRSQRIISDLLPALDNFERALQIDPDNEQTKSLLQGMEMVHRQILEALKNEGVEQIPSVGEQFDPNMHQAVMQVEDEAYESNAVVEELQKGYKLKDRVIRPSMVKVNQ